MGSSIIAELPPPWLEFLRQGTGKPGRSARIDGGIIPEGSRNRTLFEQACLLREKGYAESAIYAAITQVNIEQCQPPLDDDEVTKIINSAMTYKPGQIRVSTDAKNEFSQTNEDASAGFDPNIHLTDSGNAQRLAARHGQDIRYCGPWHKWLAWNGIRWLIDAILETLWRARETMAHTLAEAATIRDSEQRKALASFALKCENRGRLEAMISLATSERRISILPEDLDSDQWLLNTQNCTINLRTGEPQPHRRKDLITKLAPVDYDPNATCPRWLQFLDEIMDGNRSLIGFLQRLAGMALTGDTSQHILPIFYGSGRNGKGVFFNIILTILGDYGMPAPPDLLMTKKGDRHPTELAALFGKRLVCASETSEGGRLAEATVKSLTGGDVIEARRMREDFWHFSPTHKLWLATNHKPVVKGTDLAIWARLKLIPFNVSFLGREDFQLPEKLKSELPGILAWMVQGCLDWQLVGLGMPQEVSKATGEYRTESDHLAGFIEECCIVDSRAKCSAKDIYQAYMTWCLQNGERYESQKVFGAMLSERGFERYRNNGIWRRGIGIQNPSTEYGTERNQFSI